MSTFQPYPLVTIVQNKYGHLEIWKGRETEEESDLYIQLDTDIQAILVDLPKDEREEIEKGYSVSTHFLTDEYFGIG